MIGIIVGGAAIVGFAMIAMYRIVPPSEAHLIVSPGKKMVCSSDTTIAKKAGKWTSVYFHIPILRTVRKLDLTTREIIVEQETYESQQARYKVLSSTKYRINDVETAAERFVNNEELKDQLREVIKSSVRAVTVKYDVKKARAEKQTMETEIRAEMEDDFKKWGLELINFQLTDFQDTGESKIISDISRRREVEIESQTRQENAEKRKVATIKEAEADRESKEKQIERDQKVGEYEQQKLKAIAQQAQEAKTEEYKVKQIETIKQAEIDKEQAEIQAEQNKRVKVIESEQQRDSEKILKEQKQLEGQGDRLRAEERAKGEAAPILEKGLAEAKAKDAIQNALNKFTPDAIRALTAEQVVEMQKVVGVACAEAFKDSDMRVFVGGGTSSESGFELGKMISAITASNEEAANMTMTRLGIPNNVGFTSLGLEAAQEKLETKKCNQQKLKN